MKPFFLLSLVITAAIAVLAAPAGEFESVSVLAGAEADFSPASVFARNDRSKPNTGRTCFAQKGVACHYAIDIPHLKNTWYQCIWRKCTLNCKCEPKVKGMTLQKRECSTQQQKTCVVWDPKKDPKRTKLGPPPNL